MRISVIIPTLISTQKQLKLTELCIKAAKEKTSLPFELIICETKTNYFSDDADIHLYEKKETSATISINRAFSLARNDYVVLLTNDVIVDDRWLECLLECFEKKEDCGLATLASTQFNHKKQDLISEGIWFSVAMMKRRDVYFDENYINSWDDSDLIMRVYGDGKKMYRNYNCVVLHEPGNTQYIKENHMDNFNKNRAYFTNKWKDSNLHIYKVLTEGIIL